VGVSLDMGVEWPWTECGLPRAGRGHGRALSVAVGMGVYMGVGCRGLAQAGRGTEHAGWLEDREKEIAVEHTYCH